MSDSEPNTEAFGFNKKAKTKRAKAKSPKRAKAKSPKRAKAKSPKRAKAKSPKRAKVKSKSRSPKRAKAKSRSPKRAKTKAKSPKRAKAKSKSPKRAKAKSRSPKRAKAKSRSPKRAKTKSKSRSPKRAKAKSRSPKRAKAKSRSPKRVAPRTTVSREHAETKYKNRELQKYTVAELKRIAVEFDVSRKLLKAGLITEIAKHILKSNKSPRVQSPRAQSPRAQSPQAQSPRAQSPQAQSPRAQSPQAQSPTSLPPVDTDEESEDDESSTGTPAESLSPVQSRPSSPVITSPGIDSTQVHITVPGLIGSQTITAAPNVASRIDQHIIKDNPADIVNLLKEIQEDTVMDADEQQKMRYAIFKCLGLDTGVGGNKFSFNNDIDGMWVHETGTNLEDGQSI